MALKNFDEIVEKAKKSGVRNRVVIAGADAENILLGAFDAQDAGFAAPVLVGPGLKIVQMLERLGLKDKPYRLVETTPDQDVTQVAIDLSGVEEVDSSGLGALVCADTLGLSHGRRLILLSPSEPVQKLLRDVEIEGFFPAFTSEHELEGRIPDVLE